MSDQDQHLERVAEIAINDFEQGVKERRREVKLLSPFSFLIANCRLRQIFYRD
jgi:hypothetical protein